VAKEKELEKLLSEIRLKGRHAHTRNILFIVVPLLAGAVWLAISLYQVRKAQLNSSGLSKKVEEQSERLTEMQKSIEQANKILEALASPEALEKRKQINIHYTSYSSSREKVESALKGLGFSPDRIQWSSGDSAIDTISYAPGVDQDDVKLVAYAFIRTGAKLQEIKPLLDVPATKSFIRVDGVPEDAHRASLTVEEIRDKRLDFAFPVIGSFSNLNDAIEFARKVQHSITEYEPEVYLSDNGYYGVTLGGYLNGGEASKRVAFAKNRNLSTDGNPYVRVSMKWGNDLFTENH
jgi:hypothetical protein